MKTIGKGSRSRAWLAGICVLVVLAVTAGCGSHEGGTPALQLADKPASAASQAATAKQPFALLTAAMFALGTGVHASIFKKVGPRPFVLAIISTVWIAAVALTGVTVVFR